MQARFGEIGIAQADVIEAVTVPNPSVDFDVQFPVAAARINRYGWLVAQEFVQILMIPLKKKIAEEKLEAAELRVAAETLRLVAEVKAAYFTFQGDQQLLGRLKIIQETIRPRSTWRKNSLKRGISPISRCSNPKVATVRGGST